MLSVVNSAWDEYAEYSLLHVLVKRARASTSSTPRTEAEIAELEENVVTIYNSAVASIRALEEGYGFEARFYWQPTAFDRQGQDELDAYARARPGFGEVHIGATARIDDSVVDLSSILQTDDAPFFYDAVHTNEAGAALLGDAIYADLKATLAGSVK